MRLIPFIVMISTSCAAGLTQVDRVPRRTWLPCSVSHLATNISDEVRPYVEEFAADAMKREVSCYSVQNISLGKRFKTGVAGYCIPRFTVVAASDYWEAASDQERRTLIYHELGHCALDLDHTKDEDIEIMNPYILPDSLAISNWDQLVDNLFRGTEDED